jgi:hypothetical protein
MKIIKSGLSEKLMLLFLNWVKEYDNNIQHDVEDNIAWNELVKHLMELERGSVT